jgi:U3 small nucleolar RNA-associated protein 19
MHQHIIPYMHQPIMLMDFLTDSYNSGGVVSILALEGLFTLMQEHNLDYPDFYRKLYALFDDQVMHVKYRSRFFHLASLFLSSTHIPAYLIAAFIKRMARLSLTAPPSAIVIVIPFIYNLLVKHPSCMVLIHASTDTVDEQLTSDPYLASETDPAQCNALASSLWEMATLTSHYYPQVAKLALLFGEKFNKPAYNLDDFYDQSYATLFETEATRRMRKLPAVCVYKEPSLWPDKNELEQYWTFA